MKLRSVLFWGIIFALFAQSGCDVPTEVDGKTGTQTSTVSGTVVRSDNLSPVAGAIVFDEGRLATDTSDAAGSFSLQYQISSRLTTKIIATRLPGFGNDTTDVAVDPGRDTTITLTVVADSTSPIGGGVVSKAASIVLISLSESNVAIRGSGLNETSFLTFEARDSSGNPLGVSNKIFINFSIQGGPGGGEYVFPVSQETDPTTGRATTRVTSGTKAGIVQVYATTVVNGLTLRSSPVRLTVSGGLPVQQRFSINRAKANIPGGIFDGLRTNIGVLVGDREGNPVVPNTAVYFTTTGGLIQPSALTNKDGAATVELITGNPRPANGIAIITARTVGDSGIVVSQSIPVVFSGRPVIAAPTAPFLILDRSVYSFNYNVGDANGNPLSAGTTIKVTVSGSGSGDLELTGDTDITLPDTDDPSFTSFAVSVTDRVEGGSAGPVTIKIAVAGENGSTAYSFVGELRGQQGILEPPPSAREPAQITFISASAQDIFVLGVGSSTESSVLTYEVRDFLGVPLDKTRRVIVSYSLEFFPNTFVSSGSPPTLVASEDSTDDNGRVRATIRSGTRSGVVQLVVSVNTVAGIVRSSPIRLQVNSGFPDQTHFTVSAAAYNFGGLETVADLAGASTRGRDRILVHVVDKYSNPVKEGTVVYFNTQHGSIITEAAKTDPQGFVRTSVTGGGATELLAGRPYPEGVYAHPTLGPGYSYVYARTLGESGAQVIDSILILWTGKPIITNTSATTTFVVANGGTAGPFTFTVMDKYGHPMAPGTNISVSGPGLIVDGNVNFTMNDTFSIGPGTTSFTCVIGDADPTDIDPPAVTILTLAVVHPGYGTYSIVLASGSVD